MKTHSTVRGASTRESTFPLHLAKRFAQRQTGTVEMADRASGYGREVVIDHGYGVKTVYGHLSGFAVTDGQQVTRGQVIGYVGMSGRSTGPHLHYEVRIRNTPVNPHKYLRETMQQLATAGSATLTGAAQTRAESKTYERPPIWRPLLFALEIPLNMP